MLELLAAKFRNLRICEEEIINYINGKLCDIANELFSLREKILEKELVKKVLRTLPPRFAYKVTTIREDKKLKKYGT